jgi:formylglycine-generating enzyme required for sulfatase activity
MRAIMAAAAIVLAGSAFGTIKAQDLKTLAKFKDCAECPEMVVLPKGSFLMGAGRPEERLARAAGLGQMLNHIRPQAKITFKYHFAIGKYELTVAQFGAFVKATGFDASGPCLLRLPNRGPYKNKFIGEIKNSPENMLKYGVVVVRKADFKQPGAKVSPDQPAVCISRNDVAAYFKWLNKKTGRNYRLPTSAEWEYAARAGTQTVFFWGNDHRKACQYANFADRRSVYNHGPVAPCSEKNSPIGGARVGSYKPNPWGLYDIVGNVNEIVSDCYFIGYKGMPTDGSPWLSRPDDHPHDGFENGKCVTFAGRGFQFDIVVADLASARVNLGGTMNERANVMGVRVAVSLDDQAWDRK